MRTETCRFSTRRVATAAHEIISPDGLVIGWSVDERWAAAMVAGLERLVAKNGTGIVTTIAVPEDEARP